MIEHVSDLLTEAWRIRRTLRHRARVRPHGPKTLTRLHGELHHASTLLGPAPPETPDERTLAEDINWFNAFRTKRA